MNWSCTSPLLTRQAVAVEARGETVVLRVGNVDVPMHYEQALRLSAFMRAEARAIKRATGRAKTLRSLAVPTVEQGRPQPLPYTPGTAIHAKEPQAVWHPGSVGSEGRLVHVQIGDYALHMHYENALKLSQWLRVRAKEAKHTAGDTARHWSQIVSPEGSEG